MKVSAKKYAEALTESLINEKDNKVVAEKIGNFLKILQKRKKTKLLKHFLITFKKIWLDRKNQIEIKGIMPYEPSESETKNIEEALSKVLGKKIILNVKTDKSLIGGVRLEFDENIIDCSIKKNLETLKLKLVNSN